MRRFGKFLRGQSGYGLVELMITMSVFVLLVLAAGTMFDRSGESLDWNFHRVALQEELRRTIATMTREIRESSPSSPNPITTGPNTITFQIPTNVAGNTVTGWTSISYGLGPNNTVSRTANGQVTIIGSSVQGLRFTYPFNSTSPRTVQIQITGVRTTLKRNMTTIVTGQVVLRNP